jgi:hypothetical protein
MSYFAVFGAERYYRMVNRANSDLFLVTIYNDSIIVIMIHNPKFGEKCGRAIFGSGWTAIRLMNMSIFREGRTLIDRVAQWRDWCLSPVRSWVRIFPFKLSNLLHTTTIGIQMPDTRLRRFLSVQTSLDHRRRDRLVFYASARQ